MKLKLWMPVALAAVGAAVLAAPAFAAGNVTAEFDPFTGNVKVTGDVADNDVAVTWNGAGAYTFTGLNGTTVNGLPAFSVTEADSIIVDMGDGNDRLEMTDVRVRGDLRVRLGGGNDVLLMNNVRVQRRTALNGQSGDDRIIAEGGSIFRRNMLVNGEQGNDTIEFHFSRAHDRLRIDSGAGDDTILLHDESEFLDDVVVEMRTGEDELNLSDANFHDNFTADMGPGDDQVVLDDSDYHRETRISGGSGKDDLSMRSGNAFDRRPRLSSFER